MKKYLICLVIISIMVLIMAGCNNQLSNPKDGDFTIIDSIGNEVAFDKIPERIIALQPGDVEIIYALGAGEKLVAIGTYSNYPEDTDNKKKVGSGQDTNLEEIIMLQPDVIFMGKMAQTEEHFIQLRDAGIKVVICDAQTIEDTYQTINFIGKIVNKSAEAEKIVNDMKLGFEELKSKAATKTPVNLYVEVSPLQWGLWTCGKGTFIQEIFGLLNINNVFEDINGWAEVSEEIVIEKNPQYILTIVGQSYGVNNSVNEILERKNWSTIDAVKNKKVFLIDSDSSARPGPRLLDSAREIFEAVYGE